MGETLKTSSRSLTKLSDADYEVAPGERDVRGWNVVLGDEERIGKVDDLIIEPAGAKCGISMSISIARRRASSERGT